MLHQLLFLFMYIWLLLNVPISPFAGVLLYNWLDNLPPEEVYSVTLIPGYMSLVAGALTFAVWLVREKKTLPKPMWITALMLVLLAWENVTWLYALAPAAGEYEWDRTIKVIGFAILTAQMLSTRARLEAFVWVFVLSVLYFAVPGAIKFLISGGSGGIGEGEVIVAAPLSFFGERVSFSVILAMAVPFALYLGRWTTLLPSKWVQSLKPAMLAVVGSFLLALIGTFARTGLFAGGATLLMLAARSQRKVLAASIIGVTIVALLAITPENWLARMDTITEYQTESSAASRLAAWKWAWQFAQAHPITGGGFGVFTLDAGSIPGRSGWLEAHNIFFSTLAKHGYVGLVLFCCLIIGVYRSCVAIQKRSRRNKELAWADDLARATQIALVAFAVGGCFVSIDGTPALYMLAGIAIGTRSIVERELSTIALHQRVRAIGASFPQPA